MSKPDAVQTWDDSARRWVDIAAGNLGVPIQCSASSLEPGALVDGRLRLDGSHALSRSQFLAELRLPIGSKLIGTIGPLVARRRIKDLIWAIELLRIVDDDTYLIIAGEGPEEWRLHRFRDQVGIRHRVRFLGSRLGCEDCLEHLDFYWAASKRYDDPRFVKAAMSAGVPVVATDIPGHQELITSDVDGFLVKPGDRAAFARHTWRMLNDASIVDRIGTAGRRRRDKSMVE